QQQQHEAMCTLYVALTRAKRGLYVFLDPPSKKHDDSRPSLANWMMKATGLDGADAEPYEEGSIDWAEGFPALSPAPDEDEVADLRAADTAARAALLTPLAPSRMSGHGISSAQGMAFGQEVHGLLERVAWLDEQDAELPDTPAGAAARKLLESPTTRSCFLREGRDIRLLREQAIDALLEDRWISGAIDRLHIHRNAKGAVERVEIIDFKTDAVDEADQLAEAYREQLQAYRDCLQQLYPKADIRCILLSTHLAEAIEF
ncbi:MAG: PD-(D/E)XK nuclease family protein, partial [Akkermansiaceae bacterium]|nr:PD-(D/E)XK nuclease family protein [Akkermansiaceae bacterium]